MKHSTPELLKFQRLQRRLGESKRGTVGLLELLWIATIKNAPAGDIGKLSDEEIAILCDWDGDPKELMDELVETGWLSRCSTNRLVVCDWETIGRRHRDPEIDDNWDVSYEEWRRIRRRIIKRDGMLCSYCGDPIDGSPQIDHRIPRTRGGKSVDDNLCVSCGPCNASKGDKLLSEWEGRR